MEISQLEGRDGKIYWCLVLDEAELERALSPLALTSEAEGWMRLDFAPIEAPLSVAGCSRAAIGEEMAYPVPQLRRPVLLETIGSSICLVCQEVEPGQMWACSPISDDDIPF